MADRSILWTLMFRVATKRQARARLAAAGKLLGQPLVEDSCERYWKMPELWSCGATTPLRGRNAAAQLQDCCEQAFTLAYGWHFFGYDAGAKQLRGLEGVFDKKSGTHTPLGNLEWASLTLEAP